jgi:hypothetical protein
MEDYMNAVRVFRAKKKKRSRDYASADKAPAHEMERAFDRKSRDFLPWVFHKVVYHIKKKELPWRVRWLPFFYAGFKENPLKSFALLRGFSSLRLSYAGFNLQIFGAEFLQEVLAECQMLGIRPFLMWGSLLGCVRESTFIMNDHDIDMGMFIDDFKKKEALRNALVGKGFKVRIDDPYKLSILHRHVEGLFVDIDLVYEKSGYMVISNASAVEEYLYSYFFKKDIFKSLKTMQFANMDVLVPEGAEDFLETVYGDWRTPHDKNHHLYGPLNLRIEHKVEE